MSTLLQKHDLFTWENYGKEWETEHLFAYEEVDPYSVSDRYKVNNWVNLEPKTAEKNKREHRAKVNGRASRLSDNGRA